MRDLTTNRLTLPVQNTKIVFDRSNVVKEIEHNFTRFRFKTPEPHGLSQGDKVVLKKMRLKQVDGVDTKEVFSMKTMPVSVVDANTFIIDFPNYVFVEIKNYALIGENAVVEFIGVNPYDLVNDVKKIIIKSVGVEYVGSLGLNADETNAEDLVGGLVVFNKPLPYINDKGSVFVLNTWYLDKKDEFLVSETTGDITEEIEIFEEECFLTVAVPFANAMSYKLEQDNTVAEEYLNDIKESLIPEIIDNEKRQFIPTILRNSRLKFAQEIEFNLHFREKNIGEWKSTDEQIWNGFKWEKGKMDEGKIVRVNTGLTDSNPDELNKIGFSVEDVKFQRNNLKKSFIRLLFYSSRDIIGNELLCYSTIFLDSKDAYATYSDITRNVDQYNMKLKVFDDTRTDENLRISARFTVRNKHDITKSSEGYYLYLFPNEVGDENTIRTIYMKVEFNHAGYGKTIPLMLPRNCYNSNGDYVSNDNAFPLESTDDNFPTSFMKREDLGNGEKGVMTDVDRYMDATMIPVNITYDKTLKSYVYYFPWYNRASENKVIINLWEPRVRGNV